mmetsp:Transcript_13686/g.41345  ORF Transcript_13686/g.41345 Transcript_13686/m.41345 type:complete len:116 (+) Transcript_13686:647-994(+)
MVASLYAAQTRPGQTPEEAVENIPLAEVRAYLEDPQRRRHAAQVGAARPTAPVQPQAPLGGRATSHAAQPCTVPSHAEQTLCRASLKSRGTADHAGELGLNLRQKGAGPQALVLL